MRSAPLLYRLIFFWSLLAFLGSILTRCSTVKVIQGDPELSFLQGVHRIGLEYDYEDLQVDGDAEEEYLRENMEDARDGEGGAKEWKKKWYGNRTIYHNTFNSEFRDRISEVRLMVPGEKEQEDAPVKTVLDLNVIRTGFYAGPSDKNPVAFFSRTKVESRFIFLDNIGGGDTLAISKVKLRVDPDQVTTQSRLNTAYKKMAQHYGDHIRELLERRR